MVGVAGGVGRKSSTSFNLETSCNALLRELEFIWTEIGESEADKDRMLMELEMECMQVYRKKVDEASNSKARLHQTVASKEAELAALRASLGEHTLHLKADKGVKSLKEQLAFVTPMLEELKQKKLVRMKQFSEIRAQIEKISGEIADHGHVTKSETTSNCVDEHDLSMRKLNEHRVQLETLQKEKSERLKKVLEYVSEVHCLCGVLGIDFGKTVDEVHPSLHESESGQVTNISNSTLDGLHQTIVMLKSEKKTRIQKLQDTVALLCKLWKLMDSSEEEKLRFTRVMRIVGLPENDIVDFGALSTNTIAQAEEEVERFTKLKASRMRELVSQRWEDLEEICRRAHIEPDMSTAPEKANAMIDSGIMDPSELLSSIESQILKAKEECLSRKDIMDRVGKWLAACEDENWLEDYNQDQNKYNAGRGAHLNLKRAERARITVTKIPGIVENLKTRVFAWEDERNMPFMYDGVRLVSILEEYKLARRQKEEEKRRYRLHLQDQKKIRDLLLAEKESIYGSKPSPRRCNSLNRKTNSFRVNGTGTMTPAPRRVSAGGATPELLTPRSYSGRQNGYFKETRRLTTGPLNFVSLSKEETSSSFASISGSEPESPPMI